MRNKLFSTVLYLALILICCVSFLLYLNSHYLQKDTKAPVIAFSSEVLELSARDPKEVLLQGVTATDDKDGDVTASLVVAQLQLVGKEGVVRVTYAAFDAAGNVTKAARQVRFTDYESPKFTLSTALAFSANTKFDLFSIVKAQDMLDGDISHRVRITSLDDTSVSTVGNHSVQVNVSNSLGETVTLLLPVEVYAAGTYDATVTLKEYLVYVPVGHKLDARSYLKEFIRGNVTTDLEEGLPEGYSLDVKSNVQPGVPGVYTVEYRISEEAGGRSYTGYTKLIVVVEG